MIIPVGQEPPPLSAVGDTPTQPTTKARPRTGATAGRFPILNTFVDCTVAKLTRIEIAVWLILFRDTKKEGTARTGMADIARRAGCNRRSVVRAVTSLEEAGLLDIVYRGGFHRGISHYRVRPLNRVSTT